MKATGQKSKRDAFLLPSAHESTFLNKTVIFGLVGQQAGRDAADAAICHINLHANDYVSLQRQVEALKPLAGPTLTTTLAIASQRLNTLQY